MTHPHHLCFDSGTDFRVASLASNLDRSNVLLEPNYLDLVEEGFNLEDKFPHRTSKASMMSFGYFFFMAFFRHVLGQHI